jgi:predicted flap endonuclease-1-like 5' DNA nuclease
MNVLAVLVLGLLIGWLAEWVIDWFYWRNRIRPVAEENANLKEQIKVLEAEKNKRPPSAKFRFLTNEEGKDNFQAIKGIGPVFSQRLNEAGITTFKQLSTLTSQELEKILGTLYKRFFAKQESIRAQATAFAQLKAQQA